MEVKSGTNQHQPQDQVRLYLGDGSYARTADRESAAPDENKVLQKRLSNEVLLGLSVCKTIKMELLLLLQLLLLVFNLTNPFQKQEINLFLDGYMQASHYLYIQETYMDHTCLLIK